MPPLVNGAFSWRTAVPTPPCVLAVLPPLPDELQYRFVGRDLVLVDIEANLIVDVLPEAISSAAGGGLLPTSGKVFPVRESLAYLAARCAGTRYAAPLGRLWPRTVGGLER